MDVRGTLTSLSQAWRGLSASDRQGWIAGATNFQRTNNMGNKHTLSGNALYVSLNKNLVDVAVPELTTIPQPTAVDTVTVSSLVLDESSQSVVLTLGAVVPADTSIKIFLSPAVSAGVSSIGTKLRQISYANSGDGAAITLTTEYLARMGAVGAAGQKVFYKIVPVSEVSGQLGAAITGEVLIQA